MTLRDPLPPKGQKAASAAAAGADHTVNYRTRDAAKEILALTGGAGVDRIVDVDFGGNLAVSAEVIKVNGVIASYASMGEREPKLPFYALMSRNAVMRPELIYTMPERAQDEGAADVLRLCEAGRLIHQIGARFPLERIVQAHEAQESGKVLGNIAVDVGSGCRFPGCGVRVGQGHHIRHWANGGPTTLSNLALLCRRHHRAVHEEGYGVERLPDGTLRFRRPDGRILPRCRILLRRPPTPSGPLGRDTRRTDSSCTRARRCRAGWESRWTWAMRSTCFIPWRGKRRLTADTVRVTQKPTRTLTA